MPGESEGNLSAFKAYQMAKPPRPNCDLFAPGFLEPPNRLIVLANAIVEIIVFTLALFPAWVLNQQEFREEPVPDSISRNSLLPRRCFWSSGLLGIPARFDSTFRRETVGFPLPSALPSLHTLDRSFVLCPLLFPDHPPDMTES